MAKFVTVLAFIVTFAVSFPAFDLAGHNSAIQQFLGELTYGDWANNYAQNLGSNSIPQDAISRYPSFGDDGTPKMLL